ncbi:hypothetical protein V1264_013939 [Littorina saxatilis]|uniref:Uncharacterized protein n=1 Tax=Littorina saxatilis TaxID=31220 RepID=A0AAN9GIE0_9CAEN
MKYQSYLPIETTHSKNKVLSSPGINSHTHTHTHTSRFTTLIAAKSLQQWRLQIAALCQLNALYSSLIDDNLARKTFHHTARDNLCHYMHVYFILSIDTSKRWALFSMIKSCRTAGKTTVATCDLSHYCLQGQ